MGVVHAKSPDPSVNEDSMDRGEILLSHVPVKVQAVHIDGVTRTKNDIIAKHVQKVLKATNFEDMVRASQEAKILLEGLGLFKDVGVAIDTSKGHSASKNGYEVTFDVSEQRRLTGGISTMVGTNEGSLLFNLKLPNTFGRAEKVNAEYTYGTKNAMGFGVNFTKPLQGDPSLVFQVGGSQFSGEYAWSGYRETDRGVTTSLSFPTFLGRHTISWEGVWRELNCLTNTTPFAVREQSGHSLKSGLKHVYIRDTRDSSVLPNRGYLVKTTHELAGLGGDVNFLKKEAELQYNLPLFLDSVFQVSLAGGIMKTIQPGTQIQLPDKFYLGGPLTLRGFQLRGAGPMVEGCAMGADSYWLAAAHLYTPLPFRPGRGGFGDLFRTHFFFNAGNLTNVDLGDHWKANLVRMAKSLRCSYGAGIVLRMGAIARLELNYVVPVRVHRGDSSVKGLQFGIGIDFL